VAENNVLETNTQKKTQRKRGTGRLWLKGSTWWIQYYFNGAQRRESTHSDDEKKAQKLLTKRLGEAAAGIHQEPQRLTYEDLREAYMQDQVNNSMKQLRWSKDGKPRLDPVTRLDGFFKGYRASAIDTDLIRKFIAVEQDKGLANGTINRSVRSLGRMFNIAKQDGKLRSVPYFPMLKEATARQGFFEHDQYRALRDALPDYLKLPTAIGYYTGLREGEILGLKRDQIDLLDGVITLNPGATKNDEARTVPIVPELRALIVEQDVRRQPHCPEVCFRLNGKCRAVPIKRFTKAWQSACVRVGLGHWQQDTPEGTRVYIGKLFHDLRRSGVRNLVRAGVPDRVAMSISGHKTRSVFDRYNIVSRNDVKDAGKRLAAYHDSGQKSGQIPESEKPEPDKSLIIN